MLQEEELLRLDALSPKNILKCAYDEYAYLEMRRYYLKSDGYICERSQDNISLLRPIKPYSYSQSHSLVDRVQANRHLLELSDEGYSIGVLPDHLNDDCETLCAYLDSIQIDQSSSARSFEVSLNKLLTFNIVNQIINDAGLKYLVDTHLRCESIINKILAWRTVYRKNGDHNISEDAMMYHYDLDHLNFIKIFVYLDDVDSGNGAHMYIPRTSAKHRHYIDDRLRRDGRFTDDEVSDCGLHGKSIYGKRGTIIFADTRNFHKGTQITDPRRSRYMLQLQFTSSLFGAKQSHSRKELIMLNKL